MFFLPAKVNINHVKVNNSDHLSAVSFSSTVKRNRNVCAKKNQGFGQQMADGTLRMFSKTWTIDHDTVDSCREKSNHQSI
ncbi:hypothetical protein A8F95_18730 [Bacillus wudalianchiensis]|uniref:Uncharacterized protein n=2 Tax=Pseudobacillus wudalianchiensis TaxID=1743143 RepID=A0A1B9B776_9BACI|nr:hypothetical protein A8F95_18730 [Bacillus wudalianchiensis]